MGAGKASREAFRTKRPGARSARERGGAENGAGPGLPTSPELLPYLSVFGGACRAQSAISSSSAAMRASTEGGVGKGKLMTWDTGRHGRRQVSAEEEAGDRRREQGQAWQEDGAPTACPPSTTHAQNMGHGGLDTRKVHVPGERQRPSSFIHSHHPLTQKRTVLSTSCAPEAVLGDGDRKTRQGFSLH